MTSLTIYHGNEEWILKGLGVDLHRALNQFVPEITVSRLESFTSKIGNSDYHFFVQQGQLAAFVAKNGTSLLPKTICLFTHFDINKYPCEILNRCLGVMFMASSQLSVAVANGLNPSRAFVCPIGVDPQFHTILSDAQLSKVEFSDKELTGLKPRSAIGFVTRYWDKPGYTRRKRYELISSIVHTLSSLDLPVIILGPGWKDCSNRVQNENVFYCQTKYRNYPIIYNMMKVFCSLSLHEGGPMPLLESMSCGVMPVVTNTGFAYDVLSPGLNESLISTNATSAEIVSAILKSYFSVSQPQTYRDIACQFSFKNAALMIARQLN